MKYIQETVVGQNGKNICPGAVSLLRHWSKAGFLDALSVVAYKTQIHRYTLVETRIMPQAVVSAARIC